MITRTLEVGERVWIVRRTYGRPSRVERAMFFADSTDGWVNVLTTYDDGLTILTQREHLFDH